MKLLIIISFCSVLGLLLSYSIIHMIQYFEDKSIKEHLKVSLWSVALTGVLCFMLLLHDVWFPETKCPEQTTNSNSK